MYRMNEWMNVYGVCVYTLVTIDKVSDTETVVLGLSHFETPSVVSLTFLASHWM